MKGTIERMAKHFVQFKQDRCKSCELCVSVCPKKILTIDEKTFNKKGYHPAGMISGREDDCIGCANCATICPDCVISVYELTGDGNE